MSQYQYLRRRDFLRTSAGLAGMGIVTALGELPGLSNTNSAKVTVTINPSQPGIRIKRDFMGLSYEALALPRSILFRPDNIMLQKFMQQLGSRGVLRIGGNYVDQTFWTNQQILSPTNKQFITKNDIDNLFNFAGAIGWKVLLGLNLGKSTPAVAAAQAEYAARVGKDKLLALEIGNEPDLYMYNGLRSKTYNYNDFRKEFTTYLNEIRAKVPNVPISGPGACMIYNCWIFPLAKDLGSQVNLLTHHYYRMGPPSNPSTNITTLLAQDDRIEKFVQAVRTTAAQQGLQYRITESNTVYNGGKQGISNVFAAALWAVDYMFTLAKYGAAGVNFHGGGNGLYTPITDGYGIYSARPIYYGLLLFKLASQGRLLPVTISQTTVNLKAYAVLADNQNVLLTLINKDQTQKATVLIDVKGKSPQATVLRLTAPSLVSTSDIKLGGNSVNPDASWSSSSGEKIQKSGSNNYYAVSIPAGSAALITFV